MESAIDALVAPMWTVDGKANVSLAQVGYRTVGVDEGWENCRGVNASAGMRQHDSAGLPLIDHKSFPDTKAMVQEIHALGLAAGW